MNDDLFLNHYISDFIEAISPDDINQKLIEIKNGLLKVKKNNGKVLIAGNGASASMSSHFALDFTKQAKIRSLSFNNASHITAYSNDYGYENWIEKSVEHHGNVGDAVILISSSGRSPNVVKAAQKANELKMVVITLSGFDNDNPLKTNGVMNLWVNSRAYNIIEAAHAFWLAAICDLIIGKSEYSVTG